ncbi:site-specific DNA-methyltransferase [Aquibacillus salsiterrae]|uniref:Site-specific DNA-methyltransferase n=1 Tax=Aquibacillus salsiterrae TaxID=2950439 RepID=A0A9X4AHR5_9BACI|nr:site-specific DNA-methyltransferase [Aquibacillus salsiterrae]MDC3418615.1 site-specific DNA-methyltransferase [Aquibacillus salsiterrae]
MHKLLMKSVDITEKNIENIAQLFPNVITETKDDRGKVERAIDFDLLRQELSSNLVEGDKERYQLNWPGKKEAIINANTPIDKTLRPVKEESEDWDNTGNLYIEGDNLEVLKLLQESYLNKVKCIYIDPPYNTGNDFIYKDNFKGSVDEYLEESGQADEGGNRMFHNTDSSGRFHSNWMTMMYSRLKIARNLLRDDGVIFISIDDGEVSNLKKICEEIFGVQNMLGVFIWKSRQIVDSRNKTGLSNDHEYVIIVSRNIEKFKLRGKMIDLSKYSNPDKDPRGAWMSNSILGLANSSQRPNLHYPIYDPETNRMFNCPEDSGWRYSKETMKQKINEGRIIFPTKDNGRPREKKYLSELNSKFTGFSSILTEDVGFTLNGSREVRALFEGKYFDFPKPVSLVMNILQQGCDKDSIVLDFFSGSATTAHAVMRLNAQDGGDRKYIMVQLPEETDVKSEAYRAGYMNICEIGKERIRRAAKKVKEETESEFDCGFRVFKLDTSNMKDVYYSPDKLGQTEMDDLISNIKKDRTGDDLLAQVMLECGLELSLHMETRQIEGKEVLYVANNSLIACFDENVSESTIEEIAKAQPLRVVFRDSCFEDDSARINVEEKFKMLSPNTEIKVL